jgi:hypothetical protein
MTNDIGTITEHIEFNMEEAILGWDWVMKMGMRPEPTDCKCGKDHSEEKFMIVEIHTLDRQLVRLVIPEGTPLYEGILQGRLSLEAQTCLATLDATEV